MRLASIFLILASALFLLTIAPASAGDLVLTDKHNLALDGHDPVAFFTDGKPVRGKDSISAEHKGATYHFASTGNRDTFVNEADRYAPQFGGFCAYGVSLGKLFPTKVETWQIIDGRLLLNKNLDVKKVFDKDKKGNLAKADGEWPGLLQKKGK